MTDWHQPPIPSSRRRRPRRRFFLLRAAPTFHLLLSLLPLILLLSVASRPTALVLADDDANTDGGARSPDQQRCREDTMDDGTCRSPPTADDVDDERVGGEELCLSDVVLFDGLPPAGAADGSADAYGGRGTPASVLLGDGGDDAPASAGYAKVSRFSPEFEAWSSSVGDGRYPQSSRYLHVSANGDHEGWIVSVPSDPSGSVSVACLKLAKRLIAREIVADRPPYRDRRVRDVDLGGPHLLVDEEGKMFPSAESSASSWRLHLLLPRETFVHEAVSEGFVRTLSDGVTTLTTLSLVPRVFVVDPILSEEECEELISLSANGFRRSSEVHYSDEFKNYRTSLSAHVPRDAPASRRLWSRVRDVTGVPRDGGVEAPQPLKYEVGASWYKAHMDYYHNFQERPLEEVRMFVRTRAGELVRWNVSSEVRDALLGGDGGGEGGEETRVDEVISRFDDINSIMSRPLAGRLVDDVGVTIPPDPDIDARLLLHTHLTRSADRRGEFSRAAVLYAAALLERQIGDDSAEGQLRTWELAWRYFSAEEIPPLAFHGGGVDIQDYVPYVHKPVQLNNRHATVLPILRSARRGGHTSFPRSTSRMGLPPETYAEETIPECKRGLVVRPTAGQALLFYNRLPSGELDPKSEHAGCPPWEGEKYAANCFTWDTDIWWAQRFLGRADELYR